MNDPHELTVRLQALDGTWEAVGADRYAGIMPESLQHSWNAWGPDTCSFALRRSPGALHPDLTPWTPVEVEIAGRLAWDGRVKETPTSEGDDPTTSVQCEGWQYHLDDDVFERKYVHTRLSDYVDSRTIPTADLSVLTQGWNVASGGVVTLGVSQAAVIASGTLGGVTLDLGSSSTAMRLVIGWESSNNGGTTISFRARGSESPNAAVAGEDIINFTLNGGVSGTSVASFGTARRYLHLFLVANSGFTAGADTWFKINSCMAFSENVYENSNASILKADQVVRDVLGRTVFLTDTSGVQAGTFSIPEFAMQGAQSFREVLNAANAYENYDLRVALGRRGIFAPRPTAPAIEVGQWSGANFADASANSGDDIYNLVLVQGTGPDGQALSVIRGSMGPPWKPAIGTVVPNPGFETNTTGWNVFSGTIVRDTGVANTGVASCRMTTGGGGTILMYTQSSLPDTFSGLVIGRAYAVRIFVRRAASITSMMFEVHGYSEASGPHQPRITVGNTELPLGAFTPVDLSFIATDTNYQLRITTEAAASTVVGYVDDVQILASNSTMIDRRGFSRAKILPVGTSITTTSGARLGDLYLNAHRTTPFRGSLKVVGQGGVRRVLSGASVHPAHIQAGQVMRVAHVTDPDTGGQGRDGAIAAVQYDHDSLTANVTLSENRAGFEALLSRLAVVVGQAP